ncbi:putative pentatricopeptide repeat-containing protein At5g52630 [Zingiber officinale]|uniref:putative pentatricopeptide repeat-containing protein At5g52630 n=1 Tax=Zingiber officinale TaxID=94328 RepID=UPI001C4D3774|nr:putative pentatricopeptide repeat-containing protein At5g52630 [Zingiber officinale]
MASLPSLAVGGATLHRLDSDPRKLLPASAVPLEKKLAYQRSPPAAEGILEASAPPLDAQEALALLRDRTAVESAFYVPLLQRCVETKSLPDAGVVHAHIIKTGFHQETFLSTSLVNLYMKCGSTEYARKVFVTLPRRNVVAWTAMITGYVHNSQPTDAIGVFLHLLESECYPTSFTIGAVLSACCALSSIEIGKQVHGYVIKYGAESETSMGNSLCSLYSKCGSFESCLKVFERIPDKNVISWTTAISSCGDNGYPELGLSIFANMLSENVEPNEYTLTSVLSLCCMVRDLGLGKQIHSFCIKFGCEQQLPVKNSTIYLYQKCGEITEARRLFDEMDRVSLITWNAMIAGHAQRMNWAKDDIKSNLSGFEALKVFQKLNRSGTKPDLFSFSSILTVCSSLLALEQGEQIHAQTVKTGYLSDVVVSSALLNMYNKCGCIEDAIRAFLEMSTRTLISWTSMLTCYSQHGRPKEAIRLFENMRSAGVRPNQVTFVGVLSACSHAGMIDEAEYYFDMMTDEYGIRPVMDHYACMIDMFVRRGRLEDAFAFVDKMDFQPNEIIWSILIAGCRSHGNKDLGFYAAEKLLEIKPKGIETYVLLLNMYISAERWQDVAKVRSLMKDENIGIIRDRSWISIKGQVSFFLANDKSHPQSTEMYNLLENLLREATSLGYVPYKSVEFSVKEDEESSNGSSTIKHHSERLAIAFGMINTTEGATVRVVKNITMCRDCHNLVKFFTTITKREIIVRDSKRLHRFTDGKCSCGDFGAFL